MNNLSEKRRVQVRFLLGPAGTGKTFRCLEEIRAELKRPADGPPLLFLAPKQATFQIERQLLSDPELHGYTRLQILSFERAAEFVLEGMRIPRPPALTESGRVMVLRALLSQHAGDLKIFHSTARLPGFAQQLSLLLREFQRAQAHATQLVEIVGLVGAESALGRKLDDLALLLRAYQDWLREHKLEDANHVLDVATSALLHPAVQPRFAGLWLDGFAEMTEQERQFLGALVRYCERGTLAFCLEGVPTENPSWLSQWSCIGQTFRKCYAAVAAALARNPPVDVLDRKSAHGRFAHSPVLAHIEQQWAAPIPFPADKEESLVTSTATRNGTLRIVACVNPEAEAVFAAREIRRFVREEKARYRDCAVLVRHLDGYANVLLRVFRRYEIPCFLDRREPMAHHPLAELTRCALRSVVFHWRREDWFGALKTGLLDAPETDLDVLENTALAFGWEGETWLKPLQIPGDPALTERLERLHRDQLLPPFTTLSAALKTNTGKITGTQFADAVRVFWKNARVEQRLDEWTRARISDADPNPALHRTVLEQLQQWLADLELAFAGDALDLREWLTIVEAGLAGLTVGAIPPALDQVLIGAIDRSRNPDLRLAFVLGVNEGVFPAPPERPRVLNDAERSRLEAENISLGLSQKHRLGHERYYGYIAFTRSHERLVVTYARANAAGDPLNPSAFVPWLRDIAPEVLVEEFDGEVSFDAAEHAAEIIPALLQRPGEFADLERMPAIAPVLQRCRGIARAASAPDQLQLSKAIADLLYPTTLQTSVSALEQYAACPFKFFVARGLRAGERIEFEPDLRQRGSFQHKVLQLFQQRVAKEGRRWRDVCVKDAEKWIGEIGEAQLAAPENSVFRQSAAAKFVARTLIRNLQKLAATLVTWAQRYEFDPTATEFDFGVKTNDAWRIALEGGRELLLNGRMDRVDLLRGDDGRVFAAVMDYKSSAHKLENVKLEAGLDLQLLSYLGVLRSVSALAQKLGATEVVPVGAFYISLAPKRISAKGAGEGKAANPFQHVGRFQREFLERFDNRGATKGEQFRFAKKVDGDFAVKGNDGLPAADFEALLEMMENHLQRFSTELLDGRIAIHPFAHGNITACERCDYASICRFDSWTQRYRLLRSSAAVGPASVDENGGAE